MAQAQIIIDQSSNTIPIGTAGRWRDDLLLDQIVQFRNANNSDVVRWRWELQAPAGSLAVTSDPTLATFQFTPDVRGSYRVLLTVNTGGPGEVTSTVAAIYDPGGYRFPAIGETNEANYADGLPTEDGWEPALRRWLEAINQGWRVVRDVELVSNATVDLATGANPTVEIDGVTWTSNANDATNPQVSVAQFQLGSDGLSCYEPDNAIFTVDDQGAPHIWTTWGELAGDRWDPTRRWMIQVRASQPDFTSNEDGVGVALYRPQGIGLQPGVDPTVSTKVAFQRIGLFGGNRGAQLYENEQTRLRDDGLDDHDFASLVINSPSDLAGYSGISDPVDGLVPSSQVMTGGWSIVSTSAEQVFLDPDERVAIVFTGAVSSTAEMIVDRLRVLCW